MSAGHVLPGAPNANASAEDAAVARVIARLSSEYVLRILQLTIEAFGDIRAGLVGQAIATANTAHFDASNDWGRLSVGADFTSPSGARRPITVSRIADSLGFPFETTRRIVQRLIDDGVCMRVQGGVILSIATVQGPGIISAVGANVGYVRRFIRDLQAIGLADAMLLDELELAEETKRDPFAVRVVARLSAQYLLRICQLLIEIYGDVRCGVIAQTILTSNTAHLDTRTGEGWRYASIDETPPDEVRRPISVARLAESLGMPFETVRRYVRQLTEDAACIRVEGGLIVPRAVQERPAAIRGAVANVGYVRKFVRELHAALIGAGGSQPR
jgi:DNA-binding Lrp family transcriptional regulator